MARFIPPVAASAVFVLWAPFMGEIRDLVKEALPDAFARVVAGSSLTVLAGALVWALVRIRTNRLRRYGALVAAVGLLAVYLRWLRAGNAEVDAVELVHVVEYGLIAVLFYRAVRSTGDSSAFVLTLVYGFLVGTLDEWLQWLVPARVGDVRDVLINICAVAAGLLVAVGAWPMTPFTWRWRVGSARPVRRLSAAAVLVFAAFFHCAHLGYEIDDEGEHFRSFWTREELLSLQTNRSRTWSEHPPEPSALVAREDFYLTEATYHANFRNRAFATGDFIAAWHENQILERYYDPFLDVMFLKGGRHRWDAAQRASVEANSDRARRGPYISRAVALRIFVWPTKGQFWTVVLAVAIGLLAQREAQGLFSKPHARTDEVRGRKR